MPNNTEWLVAFFVALILFALIFNAWRQKKEGERKDPEPGEKEEKYEDSEPREKEEEPLTRQKIEECIRKLLEKEAIKPQTDTDILTLDFYNEAEMDSLDTAELVLNMNISLGTDIDLEIIEKEGIRNGRELVEMVIKELVVY